MIKLKNQVPKILWFKGQETLQTSTEYHKICAEISGTGNRKFKLHSGYFFLYEKPFYFFIFNLKLVHTDEYVFSFDLSKKKKSNFSLTIVVKQCFAFVVNSHCLFQIEFSKQFFSCCYIMEVTVSISISLLRFISFQISPNNCKFLFSIYDLPELKNCFGSLGKERKTWAMFHLNPSSFLLHYFSDTILLMATTGDLCVFVTLSLLSSQQWGMGRKCKHECALTLIINEFPPSAVAYLRNHYSKIGV